jgi:hypothetical protein
LLRETAIQLLTFGITGEFHQGHRCGHGSGLLMPEGIYYCGEWKDDLPHGVGMWTEPDGSVYEGQLERGVYHGLGIYVVPKRGRMLRGQWRDGGRWFAGECLPADPEMLELIRDDDDGLVL